MSDATSSDDLAFHKKNDREVFQRDLELPRQTDPFAGRRCSHDPPRPLVTHALGVCRFAENFAIGEWQVSRVHSVVGQFESAAFHAAQSLEIAKKKAISARFTLRVLMRQWPEQRQKTDPKTAADHITLACEEHCSLILVIPKREKIVENDLNGIVIA